MFAKSFNFFRPLVQSTKLVSSKQFWSHDIRKKCPLQQINYFQSSKLSKSGHEPDPKYEYLKPGDPIRWPVEQFDYVRKDSDIKTQKTFAYFMMGVAGSAFTVGVKNIIYDAVASLSASADILAVANIEVDLSTIPEGTTATLKFRGKPLYVRHRTIQEIELARSVPMAELKDPQKDQARVKRAEWVLVKGVCTHLGCVPIPGAGEFGGFYCPCHGSHYDNVGRIRKGPAPLNLEIPPYVFMDDQKILVGMDNLESAAE